LFERLVGRDIPARGSDDICQFTLVVDFIRHRVVVRNRFPMTDERPSQFEEEIRPLGCGPPRFLGVLLVIECGAEDTILIRGRWEVGYLLQTECVSVVFLSKFRLRESASVNESYPLDTSIT